MIRIKKLRIICYLCAVLIGTASILPPAVLAVETEAPASNESTNTESSEEKTSPKTDSQGRPILGEGETGILIESRSGAVLYESDSKKRMYPASTTKIMTALIAVEAVESGEVSMDEQVEITADMLKGLDPDSSSMNLTEGEIISFENLLKGLMIPSGNDAAMAIAYRLSAGTDAFVERMNTRAQELGLNDTHFMNPHGLHNENHYTTAADMAALAREAMKHDAFRNIVDIAHVKIPPTNKHESERYYISTNGLLSNMRYVGYYYKYAIGIKTGRTTEAGNCLVSAAVRNGMELIGVIFNGTDIGASHGDTIRMLDYGFDNYGLLQAVSENELLGEVKVKYGRSKDTVTLSADSDVSVVVPNGVSKEDLEIRPNLPDAVYAPLKKGQNTATVSILYQGQELGSANLRTDADIERSIFWPVMALGEKLWSITPVRIFIYLLGAAFIAFAAFMIWGFCRELKRAENHRKQRKNIK